MLSVKTRQDKTRPNIYSVGTCSSECCSDTQFTLSGLHFKKENYYGTKMHVKNYSEDYISHLGTFIQHSNYDYI